MKIEGLMENESKAVMLLKKKLEKEFNLIDFRVFGSKIKGKATADSDIDVMIEIDFVTPKVEAIIDEIIFKINLEFDCLISAIVYSRKELEEGPMSESPLYKVIEKEGIKI